MQLIKPTVPLPREIVTICKVSEEEVVPLIRKMVAIEMFREGMVSIGKAAEIAGVSRHKIMDLLAERKIPLHYTAKELREDIKTAK